MNFWGFYSNFYNALNKLVPYQEHVNSIFQTVGSTLKSSNQFYIDAGCGTGNLIRNRKNVVGIDFSQNMLKLASTHNPNSKFVIANLNDKLPFHDNTFQGGWSNNVLAYLEYPESTVAEFYRVLKPGAIFVLATLRPSFNPMIILREHLKKGSIFITIAYMLFIPILLILNIPIVYRLRKGIYKGFEIPSLKKIFETKGFQVLECKHSYADQDVLISVMKN